MARSPWCSKQTALIRLVGLMVSVPACGAGTSVSPSATSNLPTAILVGAGDIATCGLTGAESTARVLDSTSGTVFTAGDNAYESGSDAEFKNCYARTWGRHLARTRPAPGNHEYLTEAARPY